jgi:hypothetical protein
MDVNKLALMTPYQQLTTKLKAKFQMRRLFQESPRSTKGMLTAKRQPNAIQFRQVRLDVAKKELKQHVYIEISHYHWSLTATVARN